MNTNCTIEPVKYKSKLERDYADMLEILRLGGEIQYWKYEPIRFRLGYDCSYNPDFLILENEGQVRFDETKGRKHEAGMARIRMTARMFPYFRFRLVTRKNKQWQYERIKP